MQTEETTAVFPTMTSCSIPNVGASGVAQIHNGLCVLTQNIINEKIYLVLWFWYCFLGPVSVIYLCYRLITLMFHGVRYYIFCLRIITSVGHLTVYKITLQICFMTQGQSSEVEIDAIELFIFLGGGKQLCTF